MSINICTVTWLWLWGINIGYTGYSFWDHLCNFFTQIYINCFINCWTVAWHKGFFFYFLKFRNGKVTEMAKIGFFRFILLAQFLSARQASISKNIKIIFKNTIYLNYVLHNLSHVNAECKNENGLCARSYKKVKAQKLVKLLCQSTFSQLAKCFHDFLTDHNLLFVMGFFVCKKLEKFKSKCKTCFSSNHCMSINIYTVYELPCFSRRKTNSDFSRII